MPAPAIGSATAAGPSRFARYAYPPNRLGLCGPEDAPALLGASAAAADRELRALARGFEGAYPYLRLIADENGLADPLDPRVVEAYWIGNDLTSGVRPRRLHRDVAERFRGRMPAGEWRWLEAAIGGGSQPVHAFHVLEVFPRVGLLRGEGVDPIVETMDACRIRWGQVREIVDDRLIVEVRALALIDGLLQLDAPRLETVVGWRGEAGLLDGAVPGDWLSLHWGWACERLTSSQVARLAMWTRSALAVANHDQVTDR